MSKRQDRWDARFVGLAQHISSWSKDPSTKVGAVLVRPDNSVASTGFNGFAPGEDDDPELYANRDYKYKKVIHAEINALDFLDSLAKGFSFYTSFPCCPDCMRAAGEAGVVRVVFPAIDREGRDPAWIKEWEDRLSESLEVAREYGIEVRFVDV